MEVTDLRDSSDDERSFIDMTGDSDGERRPEPRVSGGGIDLTGATVRGVAATPSSAAMAWVAPPAPAPRITESPVAPRPADDDEEDEDFLAFFSSRRGPAPSPRQTPQPPPSPPPAESTLLRPTLTREESVLDKKGPGGQKRELLVHYYAADERILDEAGRRQLFGWLTRPKSEGGEGLGVKWGTTKQWCAGQCLGRSYRLRYSVDERRGEWVVRPGDEHGTATNQQIWLIGERIVRLLGLPKPFDYAVVQIYKVDDELDRILDADKLRRRRRWSATGSASCRGLVRRTRAKFCFVFTGERPVVLRVTGPKIKNSLNVNAMPRRGSDWERADSAPGKPNFYQLDDAAAEKRNSGRENYFVGAPPTPDATPTPVAKKNISADLESAQGSETTMAVVPSNVTPTEKPGPPVATPPTVGKSATPKKPKKKSLLKTLSSPVKALAKKVSPRKKPPPPPEQDTSPLSEITADRGSPRVSLEAEEIKEALAGHVDAALLAPTSPRKVPEWLLALKDALAAKCCVGDASGERGAAQ